MSKTKYSVVWRGRTPGIYTSWADCDAQIKGFPGQKFKGFKTTEEAQKAFQDGPGDYWGKQNPMPKIPSVKFALLGTPELNSIAVDGAWNTATGDIEYQGVHIVSGERIFHVGPLADGTNNVAEFLAIVHALAYCKQKSLTLPIYSDSRNAIGWVKNKLCNTKLAPTPRNQKIFELLDRAIKWLKANDYENELRKWETEAWGENPADFGRK